MVFQHKYDCFQFIFLGDKRLNSPYRPLWIRNVNAAIKVISAWEEDKRDWNPKWKAKIENREADVAEWLTMFEKRKVIYYDNLENNMIEGENATKILLDTYKHPLPQDNENSDDKTASDPEEVQNSTDADQKAIEDPGQSQEAISTNRTAKEDTAISENNTASDPEQVQNSTDTDQKAIEEISNSDDNPVSDPGQSQEAISTNNTVKKPAAISESNTASDPEQTQESTSSNQKAIAHLQKSHSNGSNKGHGQF